MHEGFLETSEHLGHDASLRFADWPIGRTINVRYNKVKISDFFFFEIVQLFFFWKLRHFRSKKLTMVILLSVYRELSQVSRMALYA